VQFFVGLVLGGLIYLCLRSAVNLVCVMLNLWPIHGLAPRTTDGAQKGSFSVSTVLVWSDCAESRLCILLGK
jgi:hypothetical protein